jgi:hypothetical protein
VKLLRWLPIVLASLHAVVTLLIFIRAIRAPERSGLLPVVMFYVDYPISIGLGRLSNVLPDDSPVEQRLTFDAITFLVLGSAWYYLLGILVRLAIRRL